MNEAHRPVLTPLMNASAMGNVEVVRDLIQSGADVNQIGPRRSTALMFATGAGHLDVVKELVECGANIELTEDGGWNALRFAEEDGEDEIANFLRDRLRFRRADEFGRGEYEKIEFEVD